MSGAVSDPLTGRCILQIIPRLDAGGAERTTIEIAGGLVKAGAAALVACEGGRLVPELMALGGEAVTLPMATKNPVRLARNIGRLQKLAAARDVAVFHARSRAPAWSALAAARRAGVPFVTTYHGTYNGRSAPKRFYNSVMARGDRVIANSSFIADHVAATHGRPLAAVDIIPRGADLVRFDPAAVTPDRVAVMRKAWGLPAALENGPLVVLLPARLTGWKGQRVLIEALARPELKDLDVVAILAGDAQGREAYVEELRALIAATGLGDGETGRVRMTGHAEDMPAAFLAADLVVTPSTDPEAFGRSAVEAQAMGRPVIASDAGGFRETVRTAAEPPATGWRVPPGDAAVLAQAIGEAAALGAEGRTALGASARAHVEQRFSMESMVAATLDVYRSLLTEAPGSPEKGRA